MPDESTKSSPWAGAVSLQFLLLKPELALQLRQICEAVELEQACYTGAIQLLQSEQLLSYGSSQSCYHDWRNCYSLLFDLGMIDLSLTRIIESHVNAVRLIESYGGDQTKAFMLTQLQGSKLFGVWHHDSAEPVKAAQTPRGYLLSGSKAFSSGLGLVSHAVVTADIDGRTARLMLVEVADFHRMDLAPWRVNAMRGSASGRYCFDKLVVDADFVFGTSSDFFKEPQHTGTRWRYCSSLVGSINLLQHELLSHLASRSQEPTSLQKSLVFESKRALETAILWSRRIAENHEERYPLCATEHQDVVLGQATVMECCEIVMSCLQKVAGSAVFFKTHPAERMLRDLRFYLHQGNRDEAKVGFAEATLAEHRAAVPDSP